MLVFIVQFGDGLRAGRVNLIEPLGALILVACGGGLAVTVLGQVVPRVRRALRSRIARRRRRRAAANAELRARATMDELCPHGWHAQITLFGASKSRIPIRPFTSGIGSRSTGRPSRTTAPMRRLFGASGDRRSALRSTRWSPTVAPTRRSSTSSRPPSLTALCGPTSEPHPETP